VYGFLQLCADRRFHRLTMLEFERVTGLGPGEYWIEARAGGAPSWSDNTKTARYAHEHGARFMGWAAHGDNCGGFPGVSNEEMRGKVERAMKSRADEFPQAEHFALFAHGAGVDVVARQAPRGTSQ
jgi:hypothetical protein